MASIGKLLTAVIGAAQGHTAGLPSTSDPCLGPKKELPNINPQTLDCNELRVQFVVITFVVQCLSQDLNEVQF
jgi:hypothetical protein